MDGLKRTEQFLEHRFEIVDDDKSVMVSSNFKFVKKCNFGDPWETACNQQTFIHMHTSFPAIKTK